MLFDMDGVLLDSTAAVERAWRWWAGRQGLDADEVVHRAHGRPSLATVREYLPGASERTVEAENRSVETRELADVDGIVALAGARELLESLPEERWAVVTSCTRALAEVRYAAGGLKRPRWLITADDVSEGKPAPEPYLLGAKRLRLAARECIVVEDVAAGVRSGKAAGARVLGLARTVSEAELRAAGADWVTAGVARLRAGAANAAGLELEID
jgi:sugar-phosphatase